MLDQKVEEIKELEEYHKNYENLQIKFDVN